MSRFFILLLALSLLVFGTALRGAGAGAAPEPVPNTHDLLATGGAGGWLNVTRPLTAADMKDRVILLDFWTYGCINCQNIVPDLEYLEQTYDDRLLVIGVHSAKFEAEQGNDRILAAAQRFGLKHPVINDSDYAIWKKFDIKAWPTLVLLDGTGAEISRYVGEGHRSALATAIAENLPAAAGPVTPVADIVAENTHENILSFPARLAYAPKTPWGDVFFVADSGHNRILMFDDAGVIKMTIGTGQRGMQDGRISEAQFNNPRGIDYFKDNLYVADTGNHALRRVNLAAGTVERVAGTGTQGYDRNVLNKSALEVEMSSPWDIEDLEGGKLAIAMAGLHQIWTYDIHNKTVNVTAGSGWEALEDGEASRAALAQPSGLSRTGQDLLFVDAESSALRILENGFRVRTLVGQGLFAFGNVDGGKESALLQHAQGLYADEDRIVVADTYNNAIRIYDRKTDILTTLPLSGGTLNEPGDVVVTGSTAWVADTNNHAIKKIDLVSGKISNFELRMP